MSPPFLSNTHLIFSTAAHFAPPRPRLRFAAMASLRRRRRKEKVVVVMGATGTGKSRLSVDLAAHFPAEIVNSDKIQVYRGLDVTTNKIASPDRRSIPHHLLGDLDPRLDLSAADFRSLAGDSIAGIASRRNLPLLAGGSNSFVHAAVVNRFDPVSDVFYGSDPVISSDLRFDCCFVWVDVSLSVLYEYLDKRVDDMLDSGMFEELADFFSVSESAEPDSRIGVGIGKAIGVPEFYRYFRKYPPAIFGRERPSGGFDPVREGVYDEAVREVKENTAVLVRRQMWKIQRLREAGWDLRRIDATEALRASLTAEMLPRWPEIWEEEVVGPSVKIVRRFVEE